MNNFTFKNPTELVFGKGQISKLASLIPAGSKVLMTYGGGSIKRNGIYDQVIAALKGFDYIEFGGIEANPDYATLMKAVKICKEEKITFLLPVGGGSTIDGTKFISAAALYEGEDPWDMVLGKKPVEKTLPLGAVLTIPATGSEMNGFAVISRRERDEKFGFFSPLFYPRFSILDPQCIYSLPERQVSNGIIDSFIHTLEQYLTNNLDTRVMDRWAEGVLLTLIEIAPKLMTDKDYDSCANFMVAATMGLNGYLGWGVDQDWATHGIGHELTALHGLDHGHTLAIVMPGVMKVMRNEKHFKLVRYAERVWGITSGTEEEKIDAAIAKTEEFFRSLGKKIRLSELGIGDDTINEIVNRFVTRGTLLGENGIVTPEKVRLILEAVK